MSVRVLLAVKEISHGIITEQSRTLFIMDINDELRNCFPFFMFMAKNFVIN